MQDISSVLYNYVFKCLDDEKDFSDLKSVKEIGYTPRIEKIREYFFGIHNNEFFSEGRRDFAHLVLPYEIISIRDGCVSLKLDDSFPDLSKGYSKRSIKLEAIEKINSDLRGNPLENLEEGKILITHVIPVDVCSKEDLKKYDSIFESYQNYIK